MSGDTALGEDGFSIISKIGLVNNFSFRPSVVFGDETLITAPVTVDFPIKSSAIFRESQTIAVPYIGGGAMISTDENSSVDFLVTGGVDVRLNDEFNANVGLDVGFSDETNVGLKFGIGYSF